MARVSRQRVMRYVYLPFFWVAILLAFTAIGIWEALRDSFRPIELWSNLLEWAREEI